MTFAQILLSVSSLLVFVLLLAAGCVALNKKAGLLGIGLLIYAAMAGGGGVFFSFVIPWLWDRGPVDVEQMETMTMLTSAISNAVQALAVALILAGVCKLSRQA